MLSGVLWSASVSVLTRSIEHFKISSIRTPILLPFVQRSVLSEQRARPYSGGKSSLHVAASSSTTTILTPTLSSAGFFNPPTPTPISLPSHYLPNTLHNHVPLHHCPLRRRRVPPPARVEVRLHSPADSELAPLPSEPTASLGMRYRASGDAWFSWLL